MMFYAQPDYLQPPAIQHPEWQQSRINFQGWPFPSATETVVGEMKSTIVGGEIGFLENLSPDFVAKDLVQYDYIKNALNANPGWKLDLSVPQTGNPFVRQEVISL
ncbi:Putative ABC transporter subunit (fragment) [Thiocapsa sp. KS1]